MHSLLAAVGGRIRHAQNHWTWGASFFPLTQGKLGSWWNCWGKKSRKKKNSIYSVFIILIFNYGSISSFFFQSCIKKKHGNGTKENSEIRYKSHILSPPQNNFHVCLFPSNPCPHAYIFWVDKSSYVFCIFTYYSL